MATWRWIPFGKAQNPYWDEASGMMPPSSPMWAAEVDEQGVTHVLPLEEPHATTGGQKRGLRG